MPVLDPGYEGGIGTWKPNLPTVPGNVGLPPLPPGAPPPNYPTLPPGYAPSPNPQTMAPWEGTPVSGYGQDNPTPGTSHPSSTGGPTSAYQQDPGVAAANAQREQGLAALDAAMKAARSREIIAWGDPLLASQAGFTVDEATAALAAQNYAAGLSYKARLDRASKLRRKALLNRLAGRGVLFSGGFGVGTSDENLLAAQETYDASEAVLGRLRQIAENDIRGRMALNQGVTQALIDAYRFYAEHPEMYGFPVAPPPATANARLY